MFGSIPLVVFVRLDALQSATGNALSEFVKKQLVKNTSARVLSLFRGTFVALTRRIRVKSSRLWRDCRGEARLARRVRRTRIVIIRGIVVIGVHRTRITDVAIIHSKTSLSVIAGEACLAPTKPCGSKANDKG